jgi:Leucine-rich repeat (LRR) protein
MKKKLFCVIIFLLALSNVSLNAQVLESDSLALVAFYDSAGGNWDTSNTWLVGPVSTWPGVVVTNNRVTELTTEGFTLINGTIAPAIGTLSELTSLKLLGLEDGPVFQDFHGTLPVELWNLTKLKKLQIKFTNITGGIPTGISSMVALEEINFQQTNLGGSLPGELFELPSLSKAYLHQSNFTGQVPATIANVDKTKITRIYLMDNKLEGPLPFVDSLLKCKFQITGNYFSYTDVKPYHDASSHYAAFSDDYQFARETKDLAVNYSIGATLNGTATGAESYAWFKEGLSTVIATTAMHQVSATTLEQEGTYVCKAQSSLVANFDLRSVYKLKITDVQGLKRDSLALVDFYNAGGGNWDKTGTWLEGPINTWAGVVVDTNGRVTELSTEGSFPVGTVSPSLGELTELQSLKLLGLEDGPVFQDFHGTLPVELWKLTKLKKLQIKFTNITGGIPAGIESMTALEEINFQQTYLGGSLPAELFELPSLSKAYLHQSNFTGKVPSTIANVKKDKITRIYLMDNKLEGPLPFVDSLLKCKFQITGNFFSFDDVKPYHDAAAHFSSFSDDYQYAKETVSADVNHNADYTMSGTVTGAEAYAWFKDAGTTPLATSDTLKLTGMTLSDEGSYICKAQTSLIANFDIRSKYVLTLIATDQVIDSLALVEFYNVAGGNWDNTNTWLVGALNTWAGVVVDSNGRVTELTTEGFTEISGTISPSIGKLSKLSSLKLIGLEEGPVVQDFNGTIPSEIWNLTNLKKLQIKFTNLTGGIPAGIETMTALDEINFQQSYLGESIPAELFELPSLAKAYLHQSNFTGKVPSTIANVDKTKITRIYLMDNKLEGPLPFVDSLLLCKLQITGNFFSFEDVKPYHDASTHYLGFSDDYQYAQEAETFNLTEGDEVSFEFYAKDGEAYAWFFNDGTTPVSTDTTYSISSVARTDSGTFVCKVQNSSVSNFDIRAKFIINEVIAIPAFVSGSSSTDGTTVSLTFDYEISDPSAEAASFVFTEAGSTIEVSSVALDVDIAQMVVLTLASPISDENSELKVTYTPGALKGVTGGSVAAFGPVTITNNLGTSVKNVDTKFSVYPNPCADKLQISGTQTISSINIIDITGQVVRTEKGLNTKTYVLKTGDLNKGVYIISVQTVASTSLHKIIKK